MRAKAGKGMMLIGAALVLAALSLFLHNRWEDEQALASAQETVSQLEALREIGVLWPDGTQEGREMTTITIDGQEYIGYLSIPVLDLTLPVMSEWSYEKLKLSPCRYSGSTFEGGFVIAAHNYSSHFGRLKELSEGDEVYFVDMDGVTWRYRVALLETLEPTEIEAMTAAGYDLTLFTCTYGGQSRVTVRCETVEE